MVDLDFGWHRTKADIVIFKCMQLDERKTKCITIIWEWPHGCWNLVSPFTRETCQQLW